MIRVQPGVGALLAHGDVRGLRDALQAAVKLEHAVIPPYLYALYSLAPGGNAAIAGIIRSVVGEEMLHLTLAANLLSAVGGHPVLDSADVLPLYPGPLPGTVDGGLVVGLAPFSVPLVRDTFMAIEEPEQPLGFDGAAPGQADAGALTIGQFYRGIRTTLVALGEGAFTGKRHHQVTTDLLPGAFAVTGVASACRAIDVIIDQGEGTLTSPLEVDGPDLAHYYRFAEIAHCRRLVRNPAAGPAAPPDQRYAYTGAPVTADPAGIRDAPLNPRLAAYPADSAARRACRAFNYTYTSLLKTLHVAFNGTPRELKSAIGLMASLQQQATDMMAGKSTGGTPVGPSFEWQPTG
ncbi:MAG TPA: ferritin-like protein [Trebonia sp.]